MKFSSKFLYLYPQTTATNSLGQRSPFLHRVTMYEVISGKGAENKWPLGDQS